MNDFFQVPADSLAADSLKQLRRYADMDLMKVELVAQSQLLIFHLSATDYMDNETAEKLKPYLRPFIAYSWKEGKFTLPNNP